MSTTDPTAPEGNAGRPDAGGPGREAVPTVAADLRRQRPDRRFPRRLYRLGREPDARFSLANERTFLAWIRTSLALTAGGVALEALAPGLQPQLRRVAAVVLIATGIAAAVYAWLGWWRSERSLRTDAPLSAPLMALPLGIALVVVGALILAAVVLA